MPTTKIFEIPISAIDVQGLLDQISAWIPQGGQRRISYVNAHCLNMAYRDREYRDRLACFDLVYPDGIGAVWAGEWMDGVQLHKLTGADWIQDFCLRAVEHGWRIYILAGKPGVAEKARSELEKQFPGLQIVGCNDGYFKQKSEEEVLSELRTLSPDVLFVGMGVPRQETWIDGPGAQVPVRIAWGVGALFDYVAGIEPRAPEWMLRLALEWLWRLIVDPSGKWKRYLVGIPVFMSRIWLEKRKEANGR